MELTTVGTLDENEDFYIVKYNEEQEPPQSPVSVTVKISKNEDTVEMTREGAFSSCLTIEKTRRNLCRYGTEYGDILMGIAGHNIEAQLDEDKGRFDFCYDIDFNGTLASKNEVIMDYKIN